MRSFSLLACVLALCFSPRTQADPPKPTSKTEKPAQALPTGLLDTKDWLKARADALEPGEIDRLVGDVLKKTKTQAAPQTTDEQFIRRAWLDLAGRLPLPADIAAFMKDKDANKRAKLIDKLLDSDDFANHWAGYFREVITSRTTDQRALLFGKYFEAWLADQFKANKNWAEITREILTSSGPMRQDEPDKNGQAFFLGSRSGADADAELAGETSRIFLGIQIQCAQCHDHPSDIWKREQFHQFAAYFARLKQRPIFEEKKLVGQQLASVPFGEHKMADKADPKKSTAMQPRFLDGKGPRPAGKFGSLGDMDRRKALANSITSKDDPWFAGAFVNRIWGSLMGQAFYQPIDDMGPQKEAVTPEVLARIAGSFRGSDYDIKRLFRDIMNSETYQRQMRPGESSEDHLLFAANSPIRMSSAALWQTLVGTLGDMANPARAMGMMKGAPPFARFGGLEFLFKQEFGFDPSTKGEEVEGSVSQALLLMNNPIINQKIQAKGNNLLARILPTYTDDNEALRMVYLRTLARRPSDREVARCREHIRSAGSRSEAFEDILWALINSTEYQTKR